MTDNVEQDCRLMKTYSNTVCMTLPCNEVSNNMFYLLNLLCDRHLITQTQCLHL